MNVNRSSPPKSDSAKREYEQQKIGENQKENILKNLTTLISIISRGVKYSSQASWGINR